MKYFPYYSVSDKSGGGSESQNPLKSVKTTPPPTKETRNDATKSTSIRSVSIGKEKK